MPIDPEVREALDAFILPWEDVSSRAMFGGVAYMVKGKMFAMLGEGVVAMKLPDELRSRALTMAGVSPFKPSGSNFGQWIQFLILLDDDVPVLIPWLEAAREYVKSLLAQAKPGRSAAR
jgi:TfoX/Sxy family transcriptional regulator of competence genes